MPAESDWVIGADVGPVTVLKSTPPDVVALYLLGPRPMAVPDPDLPLVGLLGSMPFSTTNRLLLPRLPSSARRKFGPALIWRARRDGCDGM